MTQNVKWVYTMSQVLKGDGYEFTHTRKEVISYRKQHKRLVGGEEDPLLQISQGAAAGLLL